MKTESSMISMADLGPFIKELVGEGKTVTFCVTGNSMAPLWHDRRNNVVLKGCKPSELKVGDVPLYLRDNGQYVLHRIAEINGNLFNMVGDAQTVLEEGIRFDQIQAVLSGYYTEDGKFVSVNDSEYVKYFTRRLRSRKSRLFIVRVKSFIYRIYKKIFK